MAKFHAPLNNINAVAPDGTAIIDVPVGNFTYDKFQLGISATGQVLNQIVDHFEIEIDNKVQRTITPDRLDAVYKSYAPDASSRYTIQNNVAGEVIQVPFHLFEPWRENYSAKQAPAWGTADISKLLIKVYFKSTAAADVAMTAKAIYSAVPKPVGSIVKWYDETIDVTGVRKEYNGFARADFYHSIVFHDADIDNLDVIWGTTRLYDGLTKDENDAILTGMNMSPQATNFQLEFDSSDNPGDGLPMVVPDAAGNPAPVKTFLTRLNLSDGTPRNIHATVQRVGPPD